MATRTVVAEKRKQNLHEDVFDANEDLKRPIHIQELNPQPSDDPKGLFPYLVRYDKTIDKIQPTLSIGRCL